MFIATQYYSNIILICFYHFSPIVVESLYIHEVHIPNLINVHLIVPFIHSSSHLILFTHLI